MFERDCMTFLTHALPYNFWELKHLMLIIEWSMAKLDIHLQVYVRIIPFTIFQFNSNQHYPTKVINGNHKQRSIIDDDSKKNKIKCLDQTIQSTFSNCYVFWISIIFFLEVSIQRWFYSRQQNMRLKWMQLI